MSNIKIALAGNPNSGKTSLFNQLTGLNQKVGNFPGVTVDKKVGKITLNEEFKGFVVDIPGIYGLYPRSQDEYVAHEVLIQESLENQPDVIVILVDATNLKRNLLLCSQIIDLQKPTVIALTMNDIATTQGIQIDKDELSKKLNTPVVVINPRNNEGIQELKQAIVTVYKSQQLPYSFLSTEILNIDFVSKLKEFFPDKSWYAAMQIAFHTDSNKHLTKDQIEQILHSKQNYSINSTKVQTSEILERYKKIDEIVNSVSKKKHITNIKTTTNKIDNILLHPVLGYVIMFVIMFLVFQSLFALASYPMDFIDLWTGNFKEYIAGVLPNAWWSDLITEGIISGIGGVIIFVPQIAILFLLITILEDTGYMSRVSFLTDKIMQKVGMNGRSVMPLVSGMACAIPAVMAARTISNPKERLLTILVTPFMSCSARLPVYTLLIAMIVPETTIGVFNLQGIVMMGMYLLGIVMSLLVAYVLNKMIKANSISYYIMELPYYRWPRWKNALLNMVEKSKIFLFDAGKIIIIISIVLWFMSTYGPSKDMEGIHDKYAQIEAQQPDGLTLIQEEEKANELLSSSYAGILGHAIEPSIAPLGYDWKIGIAILSSFAAREVFVGTMATLYSVGVEAEEDEGLLRDKMKNAKRADGTPVYTTATGISLLLFYAFAMQCISTIAIVKRETNSWKWAIFQTVLMTGIAYVFALAAYQLFK